MGNIFTDAELASGGSLALCTREQIKERLHITKSDDDARIDQIIAAILPTFNMRFGREFMPHVTEARTFPVTGFLVVFGAHDLRAATSVVLHPEDAALSLAAGGDYELGAFDLGATGRLRLSSRLDLMSQHLSDFGSAQIEITGDWGCWASTVDVTEDVNDAALVTALSWLDRSSSDIAMLGGGDPRFMEPSTGKGWDIPFAAKLKMDPHSRTNMGVW